MSIHVHKAVDVGVFCLSLFWLSWVAVAWWDLGMSGQFRTRLEQGAEQKRRRQQRLRGLGWAKVLPVLGLLLVLVFLIAVAPLFVFFLFDRDSPLDRLMGDVSGFGTLVGVSQVGRWLLQRAYTNLLGVSSDTDRQ
jgi:hypothetical protein